MLLKKVRKLKKITNFYLLTFELGENIRKQKKTCPSGQVLKLWLWRVGEMRVVIEIFYDIILLEIRKVYKWQK